MRILYHHSTTQVLQICLQESRSTGLLQVYRRMRLRYLVLFLFLKDRKFDSALAYPLRRPIRLLSWNILAPRFCPLSKFSGHDHNILDWSYRKLRIVQRIKESCADVVCLQEVQIDLWDSFLADLKAIGYSLAVLQSAARNHNVACAVLIREGVATVLRTESRSRALIVVLSLESNPTRLIYLANVHLEAGRGQDRNQTRFNQLQSLLRRISKQVERDTSSWGNGSDRDPFLILAGDFNLRRDDPFHQLLTGTMQPDISDARSLGLIYHDVVVDWPLLPLVDVHRRPCLQSRQESDKDDDEGEVTQNAFVDTAGSRFSSRKPMLRITHSGGSILDYIFVSHSHHARVEPWIVDPLSSDLSGPQRWPSDHHPSDHVAIGAILHLEG